MKRIVSRLLIAMLLIAGCAGPNCERTTTFRRNLSQSVVMIKVNTVVTNPIGLSETMIWSGTGFSVAASIDGSVIITNKHVCSSKGQGTYELTDYAGHRYLASYVKQAPGADLCVLRTKAIVVPAKLASHNAIKGQSVMAIGAPKGLFPWFTSGVISGKTWVDMKNDEDGPFEVHFWAQATSVPIYPGSSGSPVFDDRGEVVGVIFASYNGAEHITFMVPVSEVLQMFDTSEEIYER